jgi:hypothetical protein
LDSVCRWDIVGTGAGRFVPILTCRNVGTDNPVTIRVDVILTAEIEKFWPVMQPYFEQAVARGDGSITVQSTLDGLKAGTEYAAIACEDERPIGAATMLNAVAGDGTKIMLIGLLGSERGQFYKWIGQFNGIGHQVAAWLGAEAIEVSGRSGWTKALKEFEFKNGVLRKWVIKNKK